MTLSNPVHSRRSSWIALSTLSRLSDTVIADTVYHHCHSQPNLAVLLPLSQGCVVLLPEPARGFRAAGDDRISDMGVAGDAQMSDTGPKFPRCRMTHPTWNDAAQVVFYTCSLVKRTSPPSKGWIGGVRTS
jgi:hypothetical protein